MDPPREQPWAEHEKVYLLAEIIKAAPLPSHVLFNIIREYQIQPKWTEIALPQGRSLRSCQVAYQDLLSNYSASESRQIAVAAPYHPQQPRYPVQPPQDIPQKRPLQPELPIPTGRLIQPRPPHVFPISQDPYGGPPYQMAPMGEPPNKKKRGRPTKAEAQARADAAAARGEVYPPPNRRKVARPSGGSGEQGQSMETPGTGGSTSVTDPVTTPRVTPAEGGPESESSSGKKRRSRPTPLELGGRPSEEAVPFPDSPLQSTTLTRSEESQSYVHPTPASEAPSSAPMERRDRDIHMGGTDEFQQQSQPLPQPQQQQQQQPQPLPLPLPTQSTTPRSFKETVGM